MMQRLLLLVGLWATTGTTVAMLKKKCATTPSVILKSDFERECYSIVTGGDRESHKTGEVCVALDPKDSSKLDLVFTADPFWSMVRSQVWVGQELASGSPKGIKAVPKQSKTGAPDTRKFKNYECDWQGLKTVQFKVNLNQSCVNNEEYVITIVAHSTVQQVDAQRTLIAGSDVDAFAWEHTGEDSDLWYGYFDFVLACECPTDKTFPALPKDTSAPPTFPPSDHPSPSGFSVSPSSTSSSAPSTPAPSSTYSENPSPSGFSISPSSTSSSAPPSSTSSDNPSTLGPTKTPTTSPSSAPSSTPSDNPTTTGPTISPTSSPSSTPSSTPSGQPSTSGPTKSPTSSPSLAPSDHPTKSPTSLPSSPPTNLPTATPYCLGGTRGEPLCYPLMAMQAWEPDAGQVCIEMAEYGSSDLKVTFTLKENSFWTIWEAQVWVGKNPTDVPLKEDGSIHGKEFPYSAPALDGVSQVTVDAMVEYICPQGAKTVDLVLVTRALVAEQCIPPDGTFQLGSEYDAYGVDGALSTSSSGGFKRDLILHEAEDLPLQKAEDKTLPITIDCGCISEPKSTRRRLEELSLLPQLQKVSEDECRDVFAYHGERSHGFNEVGLNEEDQHSQFAWGWSNGPLFSSRIGYTLDMVPNVSYSGEAIAQGVPLGKAKLQYTGSEAILVMEAESNLWFKESHAYIGTEQLPHTGSNNTESINPFSYPLISSSNDNHHVERESSHTFFAAMDLPRKKPVYLVAHATLCGDFAAHEEIARHRGLKRSGRLRKRS